MMNVSRNQSGSEKVRFELLSSASHLIQNIAAANNPVGPGRRTVNAAAADPNINVLPNHTQGKFCPLCHILLRLFHLSVY
jgi:hypothetical protein